MHLSDFLGHELNRCIYTVAYGFQHALGWEGAAMWLCTQSGTHS
jgi:hypothetical protein